MDNPVTIHPGDGARIHVAKGCVHTFKNAGALPSRMLLTTRPSGFEVFFARCAEEFAVEGQPDMPRVLQIAA